MKVPLHNEDKEGEDQDETQIKKEYSFNQKSYQVDNFENHYQIVKICKICFTFYQLIQEHFDKQQIKAETIQKQQQKQTEDSFKINGIIKRLQNDFKHVEANSYPNNMLSEQTSFADQSFMQIKKNTSNDCNIPMKQVYNQQFNSLNNIQHINILEEPPKEKIQLANQILKDLEERIKKEKIDRQLMKKVQKPPILKKTRSSNLKIRFKDEVPQVLNLPRLSETERKNISEPVESEESNFREKIFSDEKRKKPSTSDSFRKQIPSDLRVQERRSLSKSHEQEKCMNRASSSSTFNQLNKLSEILPKEVALLRMQKDNSKSIQTFQNIRRDRGNQKYLNFQNYDKQNRLFRQQDNELLNLERELKTLNKNTSLNLIELLKPIPRITQKCNGSQKYARKKIILNCQDDHSALMELQNIFINSTQKYNDFNEQKEEQNIASTIQKVYPISSTSVYHPQKSLLTFRKLFTYQLNTPLNPLGEECDMEKVKDLTFLKVIELMNYPSNIYDTPFINLIQYFISDKYTAVPFICLKSNVNRTESDCGLSIVCFDFFDSLLEYKSIFQDIQQQVPGQSFILFNLPGNFY